MKQSGSINTSIIVHTPCFKHNRFLFYRLHFFSRYFKGYFDRIISHVNFSEEKHAHSIKGRKKSVEMIKFENDNSEAEIRKKNYHHDLSPTRVTILIRPLNTHHLRATDIDVM